MRSDTLGSACDTIEQMGPLHPNRTSERSCGSAARHREEELAVLRLQQSQLDSLQAQVRELAQQQTSEQMMEVANAVADMFHQLGVLRNTFNQAMNDMLRHFESPQQLPPTQLVTTQSEIFDQR